MFSFGFIISVLLGQSRSIWAVETFRIIGCNSEIMELQSDQQRFFNIRWSFEWREQSVADISFSWPM